MLNFKFKPDHANILNSLLIRPELRCSEKILDTGTGSFSLGFLTEYFPKAHVDAILYPGDKREIELIQHNIQNDNYTLLEMDLNHQLPEGAYDIVLAHMILADATKTGFTFDNLIQRLLQIKCKYIVVIDYFENPNVNFDSFESKNTKDYKVLFKVSVPKTEPEVFSNFVGNTYTGYILKML